MPQPQQTPAERIVELRRRHEILIQQLLSLRRAAADIDYSAESIRWELRGVDAEIRALETMLPKPPEAPKQ